MIVRICQYLNLLFVSSISFCRAISFSYLYFPYSIPGKQAVQPTVHISGTDSQIQNRKAAADELRPDKTLPQTGTANADFLRFHRSAHRT